MLQDDVEAEMHVIRYTVAAALRGRGEARVTVKEVRGERREDRPECV